MSTINFEELAITTAADGSGSATAQNSHVGLLYSVRYVKTDYADGMDFTLTYTQSANAATLLTATDCNASTVYYPRGDTHSTVGAAQSANSQMMAFQGKLKITVAQGGNAKSGKFYVCWLE